MTSLVTKLMVTLIVLVTLVMGIVMIYWLRNQRQSASSELEMHATQMVTLLGKTCAGPLWNIDLKSINEQLESVMADRQVFSVDLYVPGRDQPLVAKRREGEAMDPIEREIAVIYVRDQPPLSVQVGTLHLVYTRSYMYQMLAHTRLLIGAVVLVLLTSLCASTYILLKRMVKKPVGDLVAMAQRIAEGDFTTGITVSSRDELSILAETFNFMTVKLRELVENLEQRNKQLSHEVSERIRAEEDLRKSEEFLNNVVENIPNMIFVKDAKELRFVRLNKAGEDLLGYSSEELMGKNDYDFFPEDEAEFFTNKDRETLQNDNLLDIPEEPIQTKSGKKILHTKKIPILRRKGTPQYLLGISEDSTERKKAEEEKENLQSQLLQAQKMEFVGRLAGGVAHDFNNILGVILGYAELGLAQLAPDNPLYTNIDQIQRAGKRAADLTRQLLAFARKQPISPQILDLNVIVTDMLEMLRRLIGEDIDLTWSPCEKLWPVRMDPSQIDQILANLCLNARDAIAGVGKVTIETTNISFDKAYCTTHVGFIPGDYIQLTVSDDGCGMKKNILDKIFEPFFTSKDIGKGTGLGLSTVYGIIEQNGGFIHVYSEPGEGTTFRIYLTRYTGKGEKWSDVKQSAEMIGGNETILLVEDEPELIDLCKTMLESLGYRVLAAGGPSEAIMLAEQYAGAIDLVLTDVVMPEMNGRDLCKKLLSLYPDLKRVFMSGHTINIIAHHGVLEEGVCFIQKPFSLLDLSSKICEALRKE